MDGESTFVDSCGKGAPSREVAGAPTDCVTVYSEEDRLFDCRKATQALLPHPNPLDYGDVSIVNVL